MVPMNPRLIRRARKQLAYIGQLPQPEIDALGDREAWLLHKDMWITIDLSKLAKIGYIGIIPTTRLQLSRLVRSLTTPTPAVLPAKIVPTVRSSFLRRHSVKV